MLARAKSIFHLGEEGDEVARELDNSMQPPESLVGLRILLDEPKQASNVVIKHALKSSAATAFSPRIPRVSSHLGFLKSCQLCKRELSPQKDVFMYRGDQGFCSDECRARQIMFDESKEFEASTREHLGVPRHHPTPTIVGDLDQMRNISLVA